MPLSVRAIKFQTIRNSNYNAHEDEPPQTMQPHVEQLPRTKRDALNLAGELSRIVSMLSSLTIVLPPGGALTNVLILLNLPQGGSVVQKKDRLRRHLGITM